MKVFYIQCLYISGPAGRGAKKPKNDFFLNFQASGLYKKADYKLKKDH